MITDILLWDPLSKLPIAMRFATIDVADIQMARELVQQALGVQEPRYGVALQTGPFRLQKFHSFCLIVQKHLKALGPII